MNYKSVSLACATVLLVCAVAVVDADAQSRGRSGGSRGPSRGPSVGRAQPSGPRTGGPRTGPSRIYPGTRYYGPRYVTPFRSYYYPYRYPYYRFPSFALGLAFGYPYYYGYPYYRGYYGYPYYSAYPYYGGYDPYAYGGYAPPPAGYVGAGAGAAWGEIRIEGAPRDAQVYADGRLVGTASDFDGPVHHLELEAGPHTIEVRVMGMPPMTYDVDVRPGQTMSIHVNVR